jgi:hypothetical protein
MRIGRAHLFAVGVVLAAALALPAGAGATKVGLSAEATAPSECFAPQRDAYASTYCQVFAGESIEVIALASRDDGSVRLLPQPFTLLSLGPAGPVPIASFTYFDENDADDDPVIAPPRNSDYQLRFDGNADIPPATSATMVVEVGAQLAIPTRASSGAGDGVRVPATVTIPGPALRGTIELRRCHRTQGRRAGSCARPSRYTVLARRQTRETRRVTFAVAARPRSIGRYEIAFRPRAKGFATTRRAFDVIHGFDGQITYRPTSRRSPFGDF